MQQLPRLNDYGKTGALPQRRVKGSASPDILAMLALCAARGSSIGLDTLPQRSPRGRVAGLSLQSLANLRAVRIDRPMDSQADRYAVPCGTKSGDCLAMITRRAVVAGIAAISLPFVPVEDEIPDRRRDRIRQFIGRAELTDKPHVRAHNLALAAKYQREIRS